MAGRLRGQLRRHRLLPILSTSIPFIDRGLVAQEVDNPREILLLSERKRGRWCVYLLCKCVERGVVVIGIWFLV
jgi:hypothetical protein